MRGQNDRPYIPRLRHDLHRQLMHVRITPHRLQHPPTLRPRQRQPPRQMHPRKPAARHEQRIDAPPRTQFCQRRREPARRGKRCRLHLPPRKMQRHCRTQNHQLCLRPFGIRRLAMGDDQKRRHLHETKGKARAAKGKGDLLAASL